MMTSTPSAHRARRRRFRYRCIPILLLLASSCPAQEDLRDIVRRTKPAVVTIAVFDSTGTVFGVGSGFFIDGEHIITSRHVVEGAARAEYRTSSGKIYPVRGVVGDNVLADLVQLQVEPPKEEMRPLTLADNVPDEGERVIAIGSPQGLELTVSEGIVSSIREDPMAGSLLQITAPISQGSSGGPILNDRGEVVGVASWVMAEGQNLNFAVSSAKIGELPRRPTESFDAWRAAGHDLVSALSALPVPNELAGDPAAATFIVEYAMARANDYFIRRDYERAIQMTNTAITLDPKIEEAWLINGTSEIRLGHFEHAIAPLQQALRLNPKRIGIHVQLGEAFHFSGNAREAIRHYRDALAIDSTYGRAWHGLGRSLYHTDSANRTEAFDALHRAVMHDSTIGESWYLIGLIQRDRNEQKGAIEAFRRALQIQPGVREVIDELAGLYVKGGEWEQGGNLWRDYLSDHPDDAEGHLRLAIAMLRLQRYTEAIASSRESLRLRPEHGVTHYTLAMALAGNGEKEEGFRELIQAIRYDPDLGPAHHALGLAYLNFRNDKAAALDEYKILLTLDKALADDLFNAIYR